MLRMIRFGLSSVGLQVKDTISILQLGMLINAFKIILKK